MKRITITGIILALLLATMAGPLAAAVNVANIQYDGECTTATAAASSGTLTVVLTEVKDFNITYTGETASAVTITIDANSFDIIRTAAPAIELLYTGAATAATATIATDTLTITRDANSTNTTYDLTHADYNTLAELVAAIDARADMTCTLYATTYSGFTSADLVDQEATTIKTADDLTHSGTQTWDITNAAYNTVGELLTTLAAVDDITVVDWDSDHDVLCTALVDVTTQDITTLYTVLSTETITYAVATYTTFGLLEDQIELRDDLTLSPYNNQQVKDKFEILGSGTLDDQEATDIKGVADVLTAGGTVTDYYSPYYKIVGASIDDALFCLQLYQPSKWYVVYSDGTALTIIGGP